MKLLSLKIVSVPELPNNIPEYAERKTPPNMPRLHMLSAVVGSRNSGKTTTIIKLLKMYIRHKSYDKIFWWSPTARREKKFQDFMEDCEGQVQFEVFERFDEGEFVQLLEFFRAEIDEYRRYKKRLEAWRKFKKCKDVDDLTLDELALLQECDFEKPTTEYKNGFPSFALVWDDMVGSKNVFSPTCKGVTSNFWILHRHLSCSVFILSQIVANGIPRQIRGNISLWILFPCKSDKLKKDVAEELAFKVDPEMFLKIWDFCTKDQHDFLMCDYDIPDPKYMFRKNWNKVVLYDEISDLNKNDEQDDKDRRKTEEANAG
jgi:hypothetical protein